MRGRLDLLPPEALIKTGRVDHADWNFRPLLGAISRLRFRLAALLLSGHPSHRLLEVGYGSGVFMPELARHCRELYGLDLHAQQQSVAEALARVGVAAHLSSGDVTAMPYADGFFDCVVAISTLEFVHDLGRAGVEIKRVLAPAGLFIAVTPGYSRLVDLGLTLLTGENPQADFGLRRRSVIPTLLNHFVAVRRLQAPSFGGPLVRFYTALGLRVGR